MTTLRFHQGNWPAPQVFEQQVRDALARSNPVDDLLELYRELQKYEQKYAISSEEFFQRFQQGELGDDLDFIDWAGAYRLFLDRKIRVEAALMQVALWQQPIRQEAEPLPA